MRIKATDKQVQEMCALAVQASSPLGMGFLLFDPATKFKPEDFPIAPGRGVHLDYVQGRMVKLSLRRDGNVWEAPDTISSDYESWIRTYPSYAELARAAGAEVL